MSGYTHPESLVSTDWLARNLANPAVRIVDVRFSDSGPLRAEYEAGHVPGAVFCDLGDDTSDPDGEVPCRIAPQQRFARAMSSLGISSRTRVVVYDQEFGAWAARLWWALRHYGAFDLFALHLIGHDDAALYDGSWLEWGAREDLPVAVGAERA